MDPREYSETFRGKHLKLTDLKEELKRIGKGNQYTKKVDENDTIPPYPRPEFRVSHLSHDTNGNALREIVQNGMGFRAPSWGTRNAGVAYSSPDLRKDLLWWSLSVQPEDMESAEKRLLLDAKQAVGQRGFLQQFATSPAFLDTSRYGSYRLTFPLEELLRKYREQVCDGSDPVLRVYETILYKQEVQYSVLVHSSHYNETFEMYPLLDDSPDAVCAYKDGQIIWRPEAMCETHRLKLVHQTTPDNQLVAEEVWSRHEFYLWDHVALTFHLPESKTLNIDTNRMRTNLKFCMPFTGRDGKPLTVSKSREFHTPKQAKIEVEKQWPVSNYGPFNP